MRILLCCLVLISSLSSKAQIGVYNGKPKYEVIAVRASDTIGTFVLELYPSVAPKHVRNFDSLVFNRFFDSTAFHRVIPGFVIQGGDPNSKNGPRSTWGTGQPWQQNIPAEFNPISHQRSILSAARDNDKNSANSQFFVCVAAATSLDGNYTAYGKVTEGMSVVDDIVFSPRDVNDNPLQKIEMFIHRINDDTTNLVGSTTLIEPLNNAAGVSSNFTFQWNPVSNAIIYTIEFSQLADMSVIDTSIQLRGTTFKAKFLGPGEIRYYWRVSATNGGKNLTSEIRTFTTGLFPPDLLIPEDFFIFPRTGAGFKWAKVNGASTYRIQIATNPNFTTQSIKVEQAGITDTTFDITLEPSKKYFWRVCSELNTIPGEYSSSRSFTSGIQGVGINQSVVGELNLYPNPSSKFVNIVIVNNGNIDLKVFNVLSQEISIPFKVLEDKVNLDITELSKGVYFYTIKSNDIVYKGKFVKN